MPNSFEAGENDPRVFESNLEQSRKTAGDFIRPQPGGKFDRDLKAMPVLDNETILKAEAMRIPSRDRDNSRLTE